MNSYYFIGIVIVWTMDHFFFYVGDVQYVKEVDGTYWFWGRWYIIPEEIALIVTFNLFTGKGLLKYIFNLENGEVKSQASIS